MLPISLASMLASAADLAIGIVLNPGANTAAIDRQKRLQSRPWGKVSKAAKERAQGRADLDRETGRGDGAPEG